MTTSDLTHLAWAQTWQLTSLIVVVAVLVRIFAKRQPHLAHVLWLVVLAKCLTPPLIASSGSVFCWLQPVRAGESVVKGLPEVQLADPAAMGRSRLSNDSALAEAFPVVGDLPDARAALVRSVVEPSDSAASADEPIATGARSTLRISDWRRWGGSLWLFGSVALFGVAIFRWGVCLREIRRAAIESRPDLDVLVAKLSRRLRVGRQVRLIVTASRIGPAVVGLFRPTVLLPTAIVQGKAPGELEAILAHELIHVRRGDLWTGVVQVVVQGVWWFHPLVWLANRRVTRAAEACCDEEVIAELRCDPAAYAGSLLEVLELKRRLVTVPAFPGMRPVDVTRERLERIMQLGQGCRCATPWWCWIVLVLAAAATLPGAAFVVSAEEAKEEAKTPTPALSAATPLEEGKDKPVPTEAPTKMATLIQSRIRGLSQSNLRMGAFNVRVLEFVHTVPSNAPAKARITFCAHEFDKKWEQSINISADRIRSTAQSPRSEDSPIEFELDGSVVWSLGDVTASAERGKLSIVPSRLSKDAPHSQSFITLELAGATSWKSEGFCANAERLTATLGVRGSQDAPKVGVYDLQLACDSSMNGHSDEFFATADSIRIAFFDPNLWPPLDGETIAGRPCKISLNGHVSLMRPMLDTKMSTISADRIECDGRRGKLPFEYLTVTSDDRPHARKEMEGTGVNSSAGLVGTVVLAETEKTTKEKTADVAANGAVEEAMSVVTYVVADLIIPHAPLNLTIWPTEDAKPGNALQTAGEHDRNGYRVQQLLSGNATPGRNERMADFLPLVELIQASTGRYHWDEFGGSGSIRPFVTTLSLVVRNTQQVHDEIAKLLRQLRKLRDLQTMLQVEFFYFPGGSIHVPMPDSDLTEAAKRGLDPSNDQIAALRKIVADGKNKWIHESVKFTLQNGQGAELALRRLWGAGGDRERPPLMQINPAIFHDRSAIRLHIAVGAASAVDALARSRTFIVKNRRPLLLDVTDDIQAGRLGLPVVEPLVPGKLLLRTRTPEQTRGWPQILLLITPEIIVREEEDVLNIKQP